MTVVLPPPPDFVIDLILAEGKDRLAATMVDPGAIHALTTAAKAGDTTAHRMLAEIHRALVGVRQQHPEACCIACLAAIPTAARIAAFAMVHAAVAPPGRVLGLLIYEGCEQRLGTQAAIADALPARYLAELGVAPGQVRWIEDGKVEAPAVT